VKCHIKLGFQESSLKTMRNYQKTLNQDIIVDFEECMNRVYCFSISFRNSLNGILFTSASS